MTMRWSKTASAGERTRTPKRRSLLAFSALGAALLVAGCGGRAANPVSESSAFDLKLSCAHLDAEAEANSRRIDDLRDERNTNRLRNLTRVPGALIGNPLSALALADTSRAIYVEIDALEARNERLEELKQEKRCGEQDGDGFGATLVGGVMGGAASFLEKAVSVAGEAVDAAGNAADDAAKLFSDEDEDEETLDGETPEEGATEEGTVDEALVDESAVETAAAPADQAGAAAIEPAAEESSAPEPVLIDPAAADSQ